jgi:hypothetical protein
MDLGEMELCGVDWIDLAQINDQCGRLVNIVVNFRAPQIAGKFLGSCTTEGS